MVKEYKNPFTPQIIKRIQSLDAIKKKRWIKTWCVVNKLDYKQVLELIPSVILGEPRISPMPHFDGINGKGSYLYYPNVSVLGHTIQLTWGIHEVTAGDCSIKDPAYGKLALNEYAMAALVVRIFPTIQTELTANKPIIKNDEVKNEGWAYYLTNA